MYNWLVEQCRESEIVSWLVTYIGILIMALIALS